MNVMGIIFANDTNIGELTSKRTMASLPFGGRYRQVDFHLSNMTCAGIRHIGIISRHNYQSLMNHIGSGEEWGLELGEGGLEFLTPYAMSATDNYRGKLENLYAAMDFLEYGPEDELVVMADSAILSNIDLQHVLKTHIESGKDITVVTKTGIANGRKQLDLALKLDKKGEVCDICVDYVAPEGYLASMDIFVMNKKWLITQVKEHIARNLFHMDRDLVLGQWQKGQLTVNVYKHDGIALYNDSVEEYFRNSLALIDKEVRHDLFGANHPVFTKVRDRVPTYYGEGCEVEDSLVADGCIIEGEVENSIIFRGVKVGKGAKVKNCILMQGTIVGENANLDSVIADKNVIIRNSRTLTGCESFPIVIGKGRSV